MTASVHLIYPFRVDSYTDELIVVENKIATASKYRVISDGRNLSLFGVGNAGLCETVFNKVANDPAFAVPFDELGPLLEGALNRGTPKPPKGGCVLITVGYSKTYDKMAVHVLENFEQRPGWKSRIEMAPSQGVVYPFYRAHAVETLVQLRECYDPYTVDPVKPVRDLFRSLRHNMYETKETIGSGGIGGKMWKVTTTLTEVRTPVPYKFCSESEDKEFLV